MPSQIKDIAELNKESDYQVLKLKNQLVNSYVEKKLVTNNQVHSSLTSLIASSTSPLDPRLSHSPFSQTLNPGTRLAL